MFWPDWVAELLICDKLNDPIIERAVNLYLKNNVKTTKIFRIPRNW